MTPRKKKKQAAPKNSSRAKSKHHRSNAAAHQFREMNEAELREIVLIPLFRKLGYQDIVHNHGGRERGKDITMWKPDPLFGRLNYAVVAKAGPISGRTAGRGSAGEVITQIQQNFNSPFTDPRSGQPQAVNRCIVVTNGTIKEESHDAIRSAIGPQLPQVSFIDGDRLEELVHEHLPRLSVIHYLAKARESLQASAPGFNVTASAGTAGNQITLQPKPGTNVADLVIRTRFAFPDNDAGREALRSIQRHFAEGEPVEIRGDFVESLELPNALKPLLGEYGTADNAIGMLVLGPRQAPGTYVYTIAVRSGAGESVELNGLEFKAIRVGTEVLTLSNAHQALPWQFEFRFEPTKRVLGVRMNFRLKGVNVRRELHASRLLSALAMGATLQIIDEETGLSVGAAEIAPNLVRAPSAFWISLLERLNVIQEHTKVTFSIPDRDLTEGEVNTIDQIATAVSGRTVTGTVDALKADIIGSVARTLLAENAGVIPIHGLAIREVQTFNLFDQKADLGTVISAVEGLGIARDEAERLRQAVREHPTADNYSVTFTAVGQTSVEVFYLDWLPADERARIDARFS